VQQNCGDVCLRQEHYRQPERYGQPVISCVWEPNEVSGQEWTLSDDFYRSRRRKALHSCPLRLSKINGAFHGMGSQTPLTFRVVQVKSSVHMKQCCLPRWPWTQTRWCSSITTREATSEVDTWPNLPPVSPASFVLPRDIMVDSRAVVMSFFSRLRTQSILEDQRGILLEVHSFVHNQRVATARSWGAEHLLGCSVEDLFVDPDYYGYCHGLSICL